jgi:uncharacterized protein involved in exopolysaccharide biosynthesis
MYETASERGMMSMAPREPVADDVVDLRVLGRRLLARWRLVVAIVAMFTAVFAAAAFLKTPVYRATTVLAPSGTQSSGRGLLNSALGELGGVAALAGISVGSPDPQTEEALAVLKSRELTESFVREWNLMPKLFAGRWDATNHRWKASRFGSPPTPARAFEQFELQIRSVTSDKKTGLITLQIDWKDRNEAAEWANELVRRVNEEMRSRAIAEADASMAYLGKEAQAAQTVTERDAIGRLMDTQIKQRMVATVSREYAFRVVDQALPPDEDDPVKPQKGVLIAEGFLLGAIVAGLVATRSRKGSGA